MQATLNAQLQTLGEGNTRRMAEVRETLDRQLQNLQETNLAKLEEMRKTVDEKLQTTLEKRLSESFKQVAERLEQVHQGLGQMQTLAQGVGDLQKVLSNVKTRGIFGEVQLQALLDQVLTIEQYGKQVETKPRSNQRVDFAIKLPGRSDDGAAVWLPIDAKFPREDYERLLEAQNRSDAPGAEIAAKAVSVTLKICAAAFAVDPDAGVQFCNERSWSIFKQRSAHGGKYEWVVWQYDTSTSSPCYVHTHEQAKAMAAMLNAEGV
jgi:DNA recombination protein RmuC